MSQRPHKKNPGPDPAAASSSPAPPVQVTEDFLFDLSATDSAVDRNDSIGRKPEPPSADDLPTERLAVLPGARGPLSRMMDGNFLAFAAYTICNRAIPTVEDGLKPVHRRILHALRDLDDGRFIKVANVVGHTMQYHPHGDASIGDAIVTLVNKRYLIEGQGNFGNLFTGDAAAAPRYIECRLTELARQEIFNPKTTLFIGSYDGRNQEPLLLPSKLPLLLMLGADGIAVGLSTTILPHNFIELLEAQIAIIQKKPFSVMPDFQAGGLMDVSEYRDGVGRVKVRARISPRQNNRLVVTDLPHGQTTESLIESIEDAIRRKKVPVRQIDDFTAERVEIELVLNAGAAQDAAIQALYAFTACETSINSRIVALHGRRPRELTVSEILKLNTEQLLDLLNRELNIRLGELDEAFHLKTLEQIFIEERIYKRIEEMPTYEQVQQAVLQGFLPFRERLRRDVTLDDVEKMLQIRIRRISLHDINKNRQEIEGILKERGEVEANLKSLRAFAIKYLKRLIKEYRGLYPRLTEIATFDQIEMRQLTARELHLKIDRENGFIGHDIRGGEPLFDCSSLDKIIVVWSDGRYKTMPPPEKLFIDKNMIYCAIFDRDRQMTCVYTETGYGFTYLKRFTFGGAIQNKEYRLAPEKSELRLLVEGVPETIYLKYKPAKSQRIHQQAFTPSEVMVKGVGARGIQMTSKSISRIATEMPRWWESGDDAPKGVLV